MIERRTLKIIDTPKTKSPAIILGKNSLVVMTNDGKGIARALADKLIAQGCQVIIADQQIPPQAHMLILLDGLRDFDDEDAAIASNRQAFLSVQKIAAHFSEHGGTLISVQDTGGQFGLSEFSKTQAFAAGLTGLVKTAAQEWPKARCKAIDLQQANQPAPLLAERLLQEIMTEGPELEVGLLADGRRITLTASLANFLSSPKDKLNIDANSVLVVSGGARGVTAECLIELAKHSQPRLVLLGRTPLVNEAPEYQNADTEAQLRTALIAHYKACNLPLTPKQINQDIANILNNRAILHTIKTLNAAGSPTLYYNIDVLDQTQLTQVLQQVRAQWGKITGIIHGAGVLADKLITEKSLEQFDRVFKTKVIGLKNLLAATLNDPLNLIVLFSSVAARFGNSGQCDYAMANEILNKVAQYEHQHRGNICLVKSINWGPWQGGMVSQELENLFKKRGIILLPIKTGREFFVNELTAPLQDVEIIFGGMLNPPLQQTDIITTTSPTQTFNPLHHSYPFLTSHTIEDVPVLPACLVLEWFITAAQNVYPQFTFSSCHEFRVLRGARLTDFYQKGHTFTVSCELLSDQHEQKIILVKLQSDQGILHYSAKLTLHTTAAWQPPLFTPLHLSSQISGSWPWEITEIYPDPFVMDKPAQLFHGPDFAAIQALDTVSDEGGVGYLRGLHQQKNWSNQQWQIDVLALDGALQLVRLWGYRMLDQPSLPTYFDSFLLHSKELPQGQLQCIFQSQLKGIHRIVADVILIQENGQPYAQLRGLEMCTTAKPVTKGNPHV